MLCCAHARTFGDSSCGPTPPPVPAKPPLRTPEGGFPLLPLLVLLPLLLVLLPQPWLRALLLALVTLLLTLGGGEGCCGMVEASGRLSELRPISPVSRACTLSNSVTADREEDRGFEGVCASSALPPSTLGGTAAAAASCSCGCGLAALSALPPTSTAARLLQPPPAAS